METTTTLPKEEAALLAWRILEAVFTLRNLPAWNGTESAPAGDGFHAVKVEGFVRRGEPVTFVLPAFPAKSPNPEKTLGALPDLGEVLALSRLEKLCADIGAFYEPGARLVICSDGRVFSDLVGVRDADVSRYGDAIRGIIAENGLARLSTFDLDDFFEEAMSHDERRRRLVASHGEPLEAVRRRAAEEPDARRLFDGIHRFMFEDLVVLEPGLSRTKARLLAKDLAYAVIQRSNAWSRLVEARFPEAVRLSIHPQPAHSRKIGVRLVDSPNNWRTPWHSAVLFDGRQYRLVRRKEAEEGMAVLAGGKYPYFVAAQAAGGAHAGAAFN